MNSYLIKPLVQDFFQTPDLNPNHTVFSGMGDPTGQSFTR